MATGSSPIIRAASPDDSIAMAAVVRAAASPLMRETTILGGVGLDRFIRDQIASEAANRFLVAEVGGHIVGMSAWRYEGEELFLNHLFVHPSAQGRRVGTSLWARGLAGCNTGAARTLSLDVYEDNTRAAAWYRSLGLEPVAQRIVMAVPIPSVSPPRTKPGHRPFSALQTTTIVNTDFPSSRSTPGDPPIRSGGWGPTFSVSPHRCCWMMKRPWPRSIGWTLDAGCSVSMRRTDGKRQPDEGRCSLGERYDSRYP
jgi:GNAT superfamily N-acetyltransferase